MRKVALFLVMLTLLVSGCATVIPTSGDAICGGTQAARAEHAAALAKTSDDAVALTGAALIETLDAGCAE